MKNKFITFGIVALVSLLCCTFSIARATDIVHDNHVDSKNVFVSDCAFFEDKVGQEDTICPVKFDSIVVHRCGSDTTFKINGKVVGGGIHYIVFKLPNGCDSTLKIYFIKTDPYVGLDKPIQPDIGFGTGQIQIFVSIGVVTNTRNYTYKWSNGSDSTTINNLKAGQYTVTATDNYGCSRVENFNVPLVKAYDIPNAFTPNNDGVNDDFAPILHIKPNFMVFKIFNRMGNLVYNNETPDTGWDGNIKGQEAASDVYVYWLELDYGDGHILRGSGEVTLMR